MAKESAISFLLKKVDNEYASVASDGLISDIQDYIDSGNYALNALLSGSIFKGIAAGKVMAMAGEPATGKTYIALGVVENFLKAHEDGIVIYVDSESAVDSEILASRKIDQDRLLYLPVATVEQFQTQVVAAINGLIEKYPDKETRPKVLIILDSLGMLSTKAEMADADAGENKGDMGRRAKLIKGVFRVVTLQLAMHQIPMIVTNHVYSSMDKYTPAQMSGGSGLKFSAHFIVYLTKSKDRDDEKNVVGANISFTLHKGRKSVEGKKITANLNFQTGLDRFSGLLDIAIDSEVFKKDGKKIKLPNGDLLFRSEIEESPELYFTDDVLAMIDEGAKKIFTFGNSDVSEEPSEEV